MKLLPHANRGLKNGHDENGEVNMHSTDPGYFATLCLCDIKDGTEKKWQEWFKKDFDPTFKSEDYAITPLEGMLNRVRWKYIRPFIEQKTSLCTTNIISLAELALNFRSKQCILLLLSLPVKLDTEMAVKKEMPLTMLWHGLIFASKSKKVADEIFNKGIDFSQKSKEGHTIFELLNPDEKMRERYASLIKEIQPDEGHNIFRFYGDESVSFSDSKTLPWVSPLCTNRNYYRIGQLADGNTKPFKKILKYLGDLQSSASAT